MAAHITHFNLGKLLSRSIVSSLEKECVFTQPLPLPQKLSSKLWSLLRVPAMQWWKLLCFTSVKQLLHPSSVSVLSPVSTLPYSFKDLNIMLCHIFDIK